MKLPQTKLVKQSASCSVTQILPHGLTPVDCPSIAADHVAQITVGGEIVRVAGWLMAASKEKVSAIATSFESADGFLMQEEIEKRANLIPKRPEDTQSDFAQDWLRKSDPEKIEVLLDSTRLRDV